MKSIMLYSFKVIIVLAIIWIIVILFSSDFPLLLPFWIKWGSGLSLLSLLIVMFVQLIGLD